MSDVVIVRLLAAGMVLSGLSFWAFGMLSMGERTAKGRAEGYSVASFLRIIPRFAPREHFTKRGWLYRQVFVAAWVMFVACGVALAMTLPAVMNSGG